jgi:hypothetical protein
VLRYVAEGHAPTSAPNPFPEFREEAEGSRPEIVCLVEVEDDIFYFVAVHKIKNGRCPFLDPLVIQFSQIHRWNDDKCVVVMLDLEDAAGVPKFVLRHAATPQGIPTLPPLCSTPEPDLPIEGGEQISTSRDFAQELGHFGSGERSKCLGCDTFS